MDPQSVGSLRASMPAHAGFWVPLPPAPLRAGRTQAIADAQPVGTSHAASLPNAAQAASESQLLLHTPQMQLSDPQSVSSSQSFSQCVLLSVPLLAELPPQDVTNVSAPHRRAPNTDNLNHFMTFFPNLRR